MALGRLIRVQKYRSDPLATIYIVAEPQGTKAIALLQKTLSRPHEEYEDLGPVNDSMIIELGLRRGDFARL
jgi:hypothetical protein